MIELHGSAHIAARLFVVRNTVSNWIRRHTETIPEPYAVVRNGAQVEYYWDAEGVEKWVGWHARFLAAPRSARARHVHVMHSQRQLAALMTGES